MAKRIAIIEDEVSISKLYEFKFIKEGYDVKTAFNGKDGLELVEKFLPNVILLDLLMPEMNGEEMLTKLRETDWGKDIKVIILTNVSRQEAPESMANLEISRYIVKAEMTASQVAEVVKEVLLR
ncbi:MAG TPA: response regulator [Candidatus Saccharimonadales bacterium]|nr:response regulator [Candidatus Saccharimonadales bacterium]